MSLFGRKNDSSSDSKTEQERVDELLEDARKDYGTPEQRQERATAARVQINDALFGASEGGRHEGKQSRWRR